MKVVLDIVDDNGMTSVVTTLMRIPLATCYCHWRELYNIYLATSTNIGFTTKDIRKLALAFVTPLGAENDGKAVFCKERGHDNQV